MRGKLIVIEGLDGSGKATQSGLLESALRQEGCKVRKIAFPNYDSPSSGPIKMYLSGELGSRPSDVNAWAASTFYAVDRYAGCKRDWGPFLEEGGILVADRYTTSNIVHQMPKLSYPQWDEYLGWLEDLEYGKLEIPRPDLVVYLDVDFLVSRRLLVERYGSESALDIHEKDFDYLRGSREAAYWCIERLGWKRIACDTSATVDGDGEMRPVAEIANEILQIVKEKLHV